MTITPVILKTILILGIAPATFLLCACAIWNLGLPDTEKDDLGSSLFSWFAASSLVLSLSIITIVITAYAQIFGAAIQVEILVISTIGLYYLWVVTRRYCYWLAKYKHQLLDYQRTTLRARVWFATTTIGILFPIASGIGNWAWIAWLAISLSILFSCIVKPSLLLDVLKNQR